MLIFRHIKSNRSNLVFKFISQIIFPTLFKNIIYYKRDLNQIHVYILNGILVIHVLSRLISSSLNSLQNK